MNQWESQSGTNEFENQMNQNKIVYTNDFIIYYL